MKILLKSVRETQFGKIDMAVQLDDVMFELFRGGHREIDRFCLDVC